MMNKTSGRSKISLFLCLIFVSTLWSWLPFASAQQTSRPDEPGQEASLSQAQATLASLFGRGAKMPSIPRIDGTIALPSFDSSGMQIDESALIAAQRGERTAGNGGKKTNG